MPRLASSQGSVSILKISYSSFTVSTFLLSVVSVSVSELFLMVTMTKQALSCSDLEWYQELGLSCSSFIIRDRMEDREEEEDMIKDKEEESDNTVKEESEEERKKSFSRSSTIETVETVLRLE